MKASVPPPTYAFGYRRPPESGNAINGLGEARKVRARQVFHSSSGEPLAWKALDAGVDDVCAVCRRCVDDCPPQAIFQTKQLVRGERKWYVDFDKCIPYFVKTYGCAICIEVCPWSEPGRGPRLSARVLALRQARAASAIPASEEA